MPNNDKPTDTVSSNDSSEGIPRRRFLTAAAATGVVVSAGGFVNASQQGQEIQLVGRAGGWEGVAPADIEGQTNPTLALTAGQDYTVTWENGDGASHNFAIRDANGDNILSSEFMSEQGATQSVEFTASEEMAQYVCEVHPGTMVGDVQIATETTTTTTETTTEDDGDDGGDGGEQPTASVTFDDQTTDGSSVTVASVTLSDGGFVTIHDSRLQDGDALGSVVGVSDVLDAGTHEDITVALFEGVPGAGFDQAALEEAETLIAMPHFDSNDNGTYDFVTSEGEADGPYTDDDGAITDDAMVSLEEEQPSTERFVAELSGEDHGIDTRASGRAEFVADHDAEEVRYTLEVEELCNATMAHIHLGGPDESGPVVVWLYPTDQQEPRTKEGRFTGVLAEGTFTTDDLVGPLEGETIDDLKNRAEEDAYVNVHTEDHPGGEIRGQIEATE